MKTKKTLLPIIIAMIMMVMIQIPVKTIGQFTLPTHPETTVLSSNSIQNTGCDMQPFNGSTTVFMSVAVCDGSNPSFAWNNGTIFGNTPIVGSGSGAITDPDIVLTHDGLNAIIIFIQNNICYWESWKWQVSPAKYIINQGPSPLTSPFMTASNPNIDMGFDGTTDYVAATWASTSILQPAYRTVYGIVGKFSSTSFLFGPSFAVTSGVDSWTPDVCQGGRTTSSSFTYVTFAYIQGNHTGAHGVYYRGASWTSLFSGTFPTANVQTLVGSVQTYPNVISNPRIASNAFGAKPDDFGLITQAMINNQNFIYAVSRYNSITNSAVCVDCTPALYRSANSKPVITIGGDRFNTAWVYGGSVGAAQNYGSSILSRQLDFHTAATLTTNYSVMNDVYTVSYSAPSIAGRHANTSNVLYVYCTPTALYAKIVPSTCTVCKDGNVDETDNIANTDISETKVYPNPVSSDLKLDFGNEASWIGSTVELMNITGQLENKFIVDNLTTAINVSELKNGLYLLRVIKPDQTNLTKKIMIQH